MLPKTKKIVLIMIFVLSFFINGYLVLLAAGIYLFDFFELIKYAQTCIELGCPGGDRKCIEFNPEPGMTVTCTENTPMN